MKPTLKVGVQGSLSTRVGPGNTITLGDDQRATVFSTPSMINLMEYAARETLRPHLDEGEESVGIDVNIEHTSATPPRNEVTATATLTAIDRKLFRFDVVARDSWGVIGKGTHCRAVVETSQLVSKLAQKQRPPDSSAAIPAPLPIFETLKCSVRDGLLRITLNRPQKRNAISAKMTAELEQLVDWLKSKTDVRVVIVAGAEGTFCAGDDVGDLPETVEESKRLSVRRGGLYQQITELPQIWVAAMDDLVLGGGFVFASACDFRIATHRTMLGMPEVLLGWPPNYGLGIVQSLLGRGRTLELTLSGETIDARRGESIGFVNQVVPPTNLSVEATRLAEKLLAMPRKALSAAKQQLAHGRKWSDAVASDVFVDCLTSEEAQASLAKFRKAGTSKNSDANSE